ncbi:MAG: hypothetical protein J0M27_16800 [Sulfuritalea sp.]|nr:hypothetical protein [Sulfuritalea sp.]
MTFGFCGLRRSHQMPVFLLFLFDFIKRRRRRAEKGEKSTRGENRRFRGELNQFRGD